MKKLLVPIAIALVMVPTAWPAPLAAAAFARIPFIEDAEISPDGTHMAFQAAVAGTRMIAITDLEHPGAAPVRALLPDDISVLAINWVNDEQLIVRMEALRFVDGDWYINRSAAINARTGKVTMLLPELDGQNEAYLVWLPHDGSSTILLGAQGSIHMDEDFYPAIYKVDVSTGRHTAFLKPSDGVFDWIADPAGFVRAGIHYEDRTLSYKLLYRSDPHGTFHTIARADTRKGESVLYPFLLMPNDRALAMHGNSSGKDALYEVDLGTLNDVRSVWEASDGDVLAPILDSSRSTLLGARTDSQTEPVHWFDESLAKLQARFAGELPGYRVSIASLSANRRRMLVTVEAADSPGMLGLYDATRDRLERLALVNTEIGTRRLALPQLVHYEARDGLRIEAVLTLPQDRKPANLPLVVLPHGGPWAQDRLDFDYMAQFIASRGYVVLQPNFRGSTGYGDEFKHKGDGELGLAMQDDVSDGVRSAVRQGIVDPRRVCIAGASYGGYAAMWGIVKDPDQYRCSISIAGVSNVDKSTWRFAHSTMARMPLDAWKRMTPDFDAVSPIFGVDRIHTPLLLIHGRKDVTVDFGQSRRMYEKMLKAGKDVRLIEMPLADHYFHREADRAQMLSAMESFLAKYNPAD